MLYSYELLLIFVSAYRSLRLQQESKEQEEREREREREKAEKSARLFGGAKPVDTASREKEIEEKLRKEKEEFEKKLVEKEAG